MKVGFFEDDLGDKSMGRLISFMGTMESIWLTAVGSCLTVYEVIMNTPKSSGLALIGLGVGLFTTGALLKGWQKTSEAKTLVKEE